ncbi:unnamed protein product [Schistocephalus solidus]|uniref:CN hydrolase domain-containing protein n=1 Tax=Schistocephalus solidus TaxID=70667 RepID=A0A183TT67_SCHSO|nr:unnamed protein product [Schistocephalus solidus]
MGRGFVLVGEQHKLAWAAYGVAVAPTVGLVERGEMKVRYSDVPGVKNYTTPDTLTWFILPVLVVARIVATEMIPAPRSHM